MENNAKIKRSIYKRLKDFNLSFIIILGFLIFSVLWLIALAYNTKEVYNAIKTSYAQINKAVLDHSQVPNLLEVMQKYGYNTVKIEEGIKSKNSETIAQELRNFAKYMQNHESEFIRKRFNSFLIIVFIIFTLILLQFMFSIIIEKSIFSFGQKTFQTFESVVKNMYIEKIPTVPEAKFREEDYINELINEANLRIDLIDYFRLLPYLDTVNTIEEYINLVGKAICSFFKSQRFSIALISGEEVIAETAFFVEPNQPIFLDKGFKQNLSKTSLGKMIKDEMKYRIIGDLRKKEGSLSSEKIVKEGFLSNLTVPAIVNGKTIGFFFLASKKINAFNEEDGKLFYRLSLTLSPYLYHTLSMQSIVANFGDSLIDLSEFRDNETGTHIKRVALYSKILAEGMELEPRLVREIYQFSPLHDIGKVGIPDRILLKPGKLDDNEWKIMKTHVIIGVKILEGFVQRSKGIMTERALRTAINIVSDHHEKWDGSGYPFEKKGEKISTEGRILAVADVFDALTTRRPYKKAFSFEESLNIIKESSGKHFDPVVVQVFLKNRDKIYTVYNCIQ